ncbi:ribosomal protein L36-domain-containing protein [Ochromonadaceae sp. CCMP2298]|nr:ribosomal protein L36-domain-containing protein [Ochromonadaceae sp. CCMP2298]
MKVRSSIKAMCKHCYVVRRGKTRFVYCKMHAKHKQRQGFHTMAHQAGVCMCDWAAEMPRLFSTSLSVSSAAVSLPSLASLSLTTPFVATLAAPVAPRPLTYIPAVGIYSILQG